MSTYKPLSKRSFKKSRAYKLIYDPTTLLRLLYSKYGDIEEDFYIMKTNSLLYNKKSHLYIQYSEFQQDIYTEEFLKRYYRKSESSIRIPKLSDYYKNYHLFFCRPTFRNWTLLEIMHNYGDNQAEIFYKNNYTNDEEQKQPEINPKPAKKRNGNKVNSQFSNESSLSSLDNISDNKTIFDRRTRHLIDELNNRGESTYTLTLESSRITNYNELLTKRSKNSSFANFIAEVFENPKTKNNNNTGIKVKVNPSMSISSNQTINTVSRKTKIIKSSLCNLTKGKLEKYFKRNGSNTKHVKCNSNIPSTYCIENKIILSPKNQPFMTTFRSNLGEFNKIQQKMKKTSFYNKANSNYQTIHIKNKTFCPYNNHSNISNTNNPNFTSIKQQKSKNKVHTNVNHLHNNVNIGLKENGMTITINSTSNSNRYNGIYNPSNTLTQTRRKNQTYDVNNENNLKNYNTVRKSSSPKTRLSKKPSTSLSKKPKNQLLCNKPNICSINSELKHYTNNGLIRTSSSLPKYSIVTKTQDIIKNSNIKNSFSNPTKLLNSKSTKNNFSCLNVFSPTNKIVQSQRYFFTNNNTINVSHNGVKTSIYTSKIKQIDSEKKTISRNKKINRNSFSSNKTSKTKTSNLNFFIHKKAVSTIYEKIVKPSSHSSNLKVLDKKLQYQMSSKFINQIEELIRKRSKFVSSSGSQNNIFKLSPPKSSTNTIKVNGKTTKQIDSKKKMLKSNNARQNSITNMPSSNTKPRVKSLDKNRNRILSAKC